MQTVCVCRFGKPQVTLLPSVIYQTRMKEAECHGFAASVQQQNYNPLLTLMPAMDGKHNGKLLKCSWVVKNTYNLALFRCVKIL